MPAALFKLQLQDGKSGSHRAEIALDEFPSPELLWKKYKAFKGIPEEVEPVVAQEYFADGSNRLPRHYQQIAINRTVESGRSQGRKQSPSPGHGE